MRKPLFSFFNLGKTQPQKPTFGQKRADQLNERMDQALVERRKLFKGEIISEDPLKTKYAQKGALVDRKIDRLIAENSDAKK